MGNRRLIIAVRGHNVKTLMIDSSYAPNIFLVENFTAPEMVVINKYTLVRRKDVKQLLATSTFIQHTGEIV